MRCQLSSPSLVSLADYSSIVGIQSRLWTREDRPRDNRSWMVSFSFSKGKIQCYTLWEVRNIFVSLLNGSWQWPLWSPQSMNFNFDHPIVTEGFYLPGRLLIHLGGLPMPSLCVQMLLYSSSLVLGFNQCLLFRHLGSTGFNGSLLLPFMCDSVWFTFWPVPC